ncbi:hypothetical protein GGR57DRAFT_515315 [Xylariaceae sp. FL1272]|nr:hypothetical protein GGR57DRAFT_515315 [Xylariaceae sp. FL1272]
MHRSSKPSLITTNAMKQCKSFRDLPDLDNDFVPAREVFLRNQPPPRQRTHRRDREMNQCEEYLRSKWTCTDAMPDSFDPDQLEKAFIRGRLGHSRSRDARECRSEQRNTNTMDKAKGATDDQQDLIATGAESTDLKETHPPTVNDVYPSDAESQSSSAISESLDTDEQLEGYESEVSINEASTKNITRVKASTSPITARGRPISKVFEPLERKPTPRIRKGSKPPLSRSAFSGSGVPCLHGTCQGGCNGDGKGVVAVGRHAKQPKYFPFKSKVRRS